MVAAAAVAASAAVVHFFFGRNAAQFERLRDVLVDLFLHLVHLALGLDEAGGHRIRDERVALALVILDFLRRKTDALLLLVVQVLAFFGEALVLLLGAVVGEERFDAAFLHGVSRIVQDGFAEFAGLLDDDAFGRNS